jgi:lipopolysaccharide transport system permease protein
MQAEAYGFLLTAPDDAIMTRQSLQHDLSVFRLLVQRELRARYRRTIFGWAWSTLNPLTLAMVYTIVFNGFLKLQAPVGSPSGVKNFTFHLLVGLLPWNFMVNSVMNSLSAVLGSGPLVKRVRFNRVNISLSVVAAWLFSFFIELTLLLAAAIALHHAFRTAFLLIFPILILQTIFVCGLSLLFSALNVFLRDLSYILPVFFLLWLYTTPILYPADLIPVNTKIGPVTIPALKLLSFNPMLYFVNAYRDALYSGRYPSPNGWFAMGISAVIVFAIGWTVYRRLQRRFAEEL